MVLFHAALSRFNGLVQPRMLEFFAFFHAEAFHDLHDPVRTEKTHEIIFQRHIEVGCTGVPLTGGTTTQLPVDTAGVMARTAEDQQTAQFFHALAQFDVRTTTRHVGGDRDRAALTGTRHDL